MAKSRKFKHTVKASFGYDCDTIETYKEATEWIRTKESKDRFDIKTGKVFNGIRGLS